MDGCALVLRCAPAVVGGRRGLWRGRGAGGGPAGGAAVEDAVLDAAVARETPVDIRVHVLLRSLRLARPPIPSYITLLSDPVSGDLDRAQTRRAPLHPPPSSRHAREGGLRPAGLIDHSKRASREKGRRAAIPAVPTLPRHSAGSGTRCVSPIRLPIRDLLEAVTPFSVNPNLIPPPIPTIDACEFLHPYPPHRHLRFCCVLIEKVAWKKHCV